jgi:hypothetical protein
MKIELLATLVIFEDTRRPVILFCFMAEETPDSQSFIFTITLSDVQLAVDSKAAMINSFSAKLGKVIPECKKLGCHRDRT